MTITFRIVEANARSHDTVVNNGLKIELDLVPLTGTERQIAWALKIRETMVEAGLREMLRGNKTAQSALMSVADHDALVAETNHRFAQLDGLIGKATTAKFWIDMREAGFREVLRRLAAEHGRPA